MIPNMPAQPMPGWLLHILENPEKVSFNPAELVEDSLYYPACGFNGTPVKYLGGNIHSFIYVDYSISKEDFLGNLAGTGDNDGFKGYEMVLGRDLQASDIMAPGWQPQIVPPAGGRPARYPFTSPPPFAHWSVWKKSDSNVEFDQPEAFSFLYINGEMSATYQGLYYQHNTKPLVLVIIQPGAFGGEWERVEAEDSFFYHVLSSNPSGLPEYLLHGGFGGPQFYEQPPWSKYEGDRLVQLPERYAGLYRLNS